MPKSRLRMAGALVLVSAVTGLSSACGEAAAQDSKMMVVTTVAPMTSIVSAVAGDKINVEGVIPEGADSHTFEPSPKIAEVMAKADVVFVNGLGLEDPTKELARKNMRKKAEIVEVGTAVLPRA